MTLHKNEQVTLSVTDFTDAGLGVGRVEGVPVFVSGAVIGDTVRAKVTKVLKKYAFARTEEIVYASEDRVEAPCAHASQCGGCQLQSYAYPAQTAFKEKKVKDALVRIGGFDEADVERIVRQALAMEEPLRYRNKAQFPVGASMDDIVCGFYAVHSHRIVPLEDCMIGVPENKKVLRAVKESMRMADVQPYNETDGTGHVRHVLIRKAFATGQIMVCVVVNAEEALSRFRDVLILQLTELSGVTSICLNFNTRRDNVIMGAVTETIYGKPYIEDELCGLRFRISAPSFYQVNPVMTKTLYETVCAFALENLPEGITHPVVWDLYCGIGTISLALAKAKEEAEVAGIEVVPEAVADAKENAKLNGIGNASFLEGRAEELLADASGAGLSRPDVVVLDPPRKGCDAHLLTALREACPARIVYVSCDPATLARDLKVLCADGAYRPEAVRPFDMFPMTTHVETVVLLSHKKPDPQSA